jgi:hypothetical protein
MAYRLKKGDLYHKEVVEIFQVATHNKAEAKVFKTVQEAKRYIDYQRIDPEYEIELERKPE